MKSMESAPAPRGLSDEQRVFYEEDLLVKSDRTKAKAIAAYNMCLATAAKLRWFNQYSEEAQQSLSKLDYSFKFIKEHRTQTGHAVATACPVWVRCSLMNLKE